MCHRKWRHVVRIFPQGTGGRGHENRRGHAGVFQVVAEL